jgi:hypothetical protein
MKELAVTTPKRQAEAAKLDAVIVACQRRGFGRQAHRKELGYDA